MKQKVAVQLTGYFRTFHKCVDTWKNLLDYDLYDFDFFIHTYKSHGFSKGFNTEIDSNDEVDFDEVKKKINVKDIVIEDEFYNYGEIIPAGHYKNRVMLMFRKFLLCNELQKEYVKKTNEQYEFIIRMRPDLSFNEKVKFTKPNKNTIIFNKYVYSDVYINPFEKEGLNDQIAICSVDTIDKYSDIFNSDNRIFNLQPETALHRHIKEKKINIQLEDLKMNITRRDD
jgi:hypothetical protein